MYKIKNILIKIKAFCKSAYITIKRIFNPFINNAEKNIKDNDIKFYLNDNYFELMSLNFSNSKNLLITFDEYINELFNNLRTIPNLEMICFKARIHYIITNSESVSIYETKSIIITKELLIKNSSQSFEQIQKLKKEIITLNEKYNVDLSSITTISLIGHIYPKNYKIEDSFIETIKINQNKIK